MNTPTQEDRAKAIQFARNHNSAELFQYCKDNGDLGSLAKLMIDFASARAEVATEARDNHFAQGYACAAAVMVKLQGGETTENRELLQAGMGGATAESLRAQGVDESDIETLAPVLAEIERRRNL